MNINKNILLNNGFKFREFEDNSKNNHSGDFELFKFEKYRIYFTLSEPENIWYLDIVNYENYKHFEFRNQKEISIEEINLALRLCGIDITIKADEINNTILKNYGFEKK